jgi:outer membrane immunogenic protein
MIRAPGTAMNALRLLALGTAICASGGLVARADGRPEPVIYTPKPPICCEVAYFGYDWSGFYLGGHAGVAFTASEWSILGPGLLEHSASGFAGGAQIGLQKQWANIVAGIEVSYTGLDGDITSHTSFLGTPVTRSSDVSNLLLVTGRLGYAQDNMLAYVKAGYATADVEFGFRLPGTATAGSSSDREDGWTAGVGFEYAIRDNIILGIEYNYVRLKVDDRVLAPTTIVTDNGGIDLQSILARISFKFGARPEAAALK